MPAPRWIAVGLAILLGLPAAGSMAAGSIAAAVASAVTEGADQPSAPSADFSCTLVLGFSQTRQWFDAPAFERMVGDDRWQGSFRNGGAIELWATPGSDVWDQPIVSPCAEGSESPDRILLSVSSDREPDPAWWQAEIEGALAMARSEYPSVRQFLLQPVVGGPDDGVCQFDGQNVRATDNHPVIDTAIAMVVDAQEGSDIAAGWSAAVADCGMYRDATGHLNAAGVVAVGRAAGDYYRALDAQPTQAPPPSATITASPPQIPSPTAPPGNLTQTPTHALPAIYLPLLLSSMGLDQLARPSVQVQTEHGPVVGNDLGQSLGWLGVPYAAPPVGDLRWQPPQAPEPWTEPLRAEAHGNSCPQYEGDSVVGDEDCLTLNLWSPAAGAAASAPGPWPVLVFIHGGGHEQGSSDLRIGTDDTLLYDGRSMAEEQGVVVVTINYRLGPLGFLAHPALTAEREGPGSGNYGMLDQVLALEWVQANIAGFGGDSERVMVFGQSAGGVSVCRLLISPLAEGLFSAAGIHSGGCAATPMERAETHGLEVAGELGCAMAADPPACMRAASMAEVMGTHEAAENGVVSLGRNAYDGVVDGLAVPDAPMSLIRAGQYHAVPLIIGSTAAETGRDAPLIADEAAYEAAVRAYAAAAGLPAALVDRILASYPAADYPTPRDAFVALTSDIKFVCGAGRIAREVSQRQSEPVFRWSFEHVADRAGAVARAQGAVHGAELPYLFGVLEFATRVGRYQPGPGDLTVSTDMQGYWARFAAAGDPNGDGALDWPRFTLAEEPYMQLVPELEIGAELRGAQCDFWDGLRP